MDRRLTVSTRVGAVALVLALGACNLRPGSPSPESSAPDFAQDAQLPAAPTVVVDGADPVTLAIGTSRALFASAAVVVLTDDDPTDLASAATTAQREHAPVLLIPTPPPAGSPSPDPRASATADPAATAVTAEIARLAPRDLVLVGQQAAAWASGADPLVSIDKLTDLTSLPTVTAAAALTNLVVLAQPGDAAAQATAAAVGAQVIELANPDPRGSDDEIKALTGLTIDHLLAVGSAFGPADQLRVRVETAATGVTLPGGNQIVFPGRRMVALYGYPNDPGLGVLGEQPLDQTITRAQSVAAQYSGLVGEPVVPTFEIIATVAAGSAGPDGNYSNESDPNDLRPWIDAARQAGIYVMLDLQPGRSDFLSQAKLYADLLKEPNVGLALDPEWRLTSDEVPMQVIGSVDASEINQVGAWLNDLTLSNRLPQKIFILHQFQLAMITNRSSLVTDYDGLRVLIHADGFGSPGAKFDTWDALHLDAPPNIWWGWKNFYDEDQPTFTPAQTVAVDPSPVFISYQ